jgi:NAD(P)-dependent dehydrogenase (short-subunit alcohol dehydrogenase family)
MLKPAHLTTKEDLDQVLQQNLYTAFSVVRAAAKTMKKQGNVILMSTVAARVGLANHEAIAAAKAGVIGLAQAAAASYARRHLRFNVIAPGLVDTPLAKPITSNDKAREASEKMHPLGTLGTPANIAAAIDWLVSPDNHWMTGQVIGIDGGLSTVRPIS